MEDNQKSLKQFIRLLNTDIPGNHPVQRGLIKIKGIGKNLSHAICIRLGLDSKRAINTFSQDELRELETKIKSMANVEGWLLNRRKDYDSGKDKHLLTTDIKFRRDFDIKRLQKIKSYRGLRHAAGLPVRGQRTRAHFRKGKAVGVAKKKKGGSSGGKK